VERLPSDYTPRHLAERILTSRSALEGERKRVTVLFADVVDSTVLAHRVDVEEWHRILDGLFRVLADGVHRFEGTVNQYTGDGIMALFGAPIAHEDHARRACYAALHLADRLDAYAAELSRRGLDLGVRMGLNSGDVVVGKIGDDLRMDYTAQGVTVSLASRIQELAGPGQICVSADTARDVQELVTLVDLGPQMLKGFATAVPAFELTGARAPAPFGVSTEGGLSELVGRDSDLDVLRRALAEARSGNGQIVQIVGDPGVGKSRLCLELARLCQQDGIESSEVTCPSHGRNLPLHAVRALLRSRFVLAPGDGDDIAREKIQHGLERLRIPGDGALALACDLLDVRVPSLARLDLTEEKREERQLHLVRRFVQAQSRESPAVLFVDDVQWLDQASARFVDAIAEALGWTRTLLVLSGRTSLPLPGSVRSYRTELHVQPLSEEHARSLARALLGDDPSVAGLADRVVERTAGSPLFTQETVRDLVRSDALVGEPGAYRLAHPIAELAMPDSVRSLLAARIDRLSESAKQLLQIGAVIGRFDERALLGSAAEMTDPELDAALLELREAGLVHQAAFAHPLIRETAYESLLLESRRALHMAVARALEQIHAEELGRSASLIAHHWETAERPWIAQRWRHRAALRVSQIQVRRQDAPR
jgi:class 3 adenylate cyclase/nucleoside-triphosphatase THEP1